jgi:hypothetical protein
MPLNFFWLSAGNPAWSTLSAIFKRKAIRLKENLLQILDLNAEQVETRAEDQLVLRNTANRATADSDKKKLLLMKLAKERKSPEVKRSRDRLEEFIRTPENLVGSRVEHRCFNEEGEAEWSEWSVIGVFKHNTNPLKVEFSMKYDIDESNDDERNFNLLSDLKGDLIICT